jgi:CHAT domain-containing protein/Tfp pilus assembly protein PilF
VEEIMRVVSGLLLNCVLSMLLVQGTAVQTQSPQAQPKLTPEQQEQLKERDGLSKQALQLKAQGKFAEAVTIAEKALAIARKMRGEEHAEVADSLENVAALRELSGDFTAAVKERNQVLTLRTKLDGEKHWRTANARVAVEFAEKMAGLPEADRTRILDALRKEQQAIKLANQGQKSRAERLGMEVLEVYRTDLGAETVEIARIWQLLGDVRSDSKSAKEALEEAIKIRRKLFPADHFEIGTCLGMLGRVQADLLDYKAARKSIEQALEIHRKVLPTNHHNIYADFTNLGMVLCELRDYGAARTNFEEALAILRATLPPKSPRIAWSLINLGNAQSMLEDYVAARKNFEEALEIRRGFSPPRPHEVAECLTKLGFAQFNLYDFAAARKSYQESLDIHRSISPANSSALARAIGSLADVEENLELFTLARKHYEEALEIFRRANFPTDTATCLSNLGVLYLTLREFTAARRSFEEALEIRIKNLKPEDTQIADTLVNLSTLHGKLKQYVTARSYIERALTVYRSSSQPNPAQIARCLHNLGNVQFSLGEPIAARQCFEDAVINYGKILPTDHPLIAKSLDNLGLVLAKLGKNQEARKSHLDALSLFRKSLPSDSPEIATCLHHLGLSALSTGLGLNESIKFELESIDIQLSAQQQLALAQAEEEQLLAAQDSRNTLALLLSTTLATQAESVTTYNRLLRVKGSVTTQQRLARQLRDSRDPETARILARLKLINREMVGLSAIEKTADAPNRLREVTATLRKFSTARSELERQLTGRSNAYRAFQDQAKMDAATVRSALPKETALIDIAVYVHFTPPAADEKGPSTEQRVLAFIVRPDRQDVVMVPLGSAESLFETIDRWRDRHVLNKPPPADSADPGLELRKRLWEPLAKHLDGVKVVLVSPDDRLNNLPLAALPGDKPGTYLIHQYAFATVPVPQLLPALLKGKAELPAEPASLIVGDIDFDAEPNSTAATRGNDQFPRLTGTREETLAVHDLFCKLFSGRPAELLAGKAATKSAFVERAVKCSHLHIATHGFFIPEPEEKNLSSLLHPSDSLLHRPDLVRVNPGLRSGLVFAGANRTALGKGDAFLTALEVAEMELQRVDLAVLSACETGLGQVHGGEGVLGLQRAFQVAGARTAVTSLWKVDDQATEVLMTRFHQNLWEKKMGKLESLREAQLWLLKEGWKDPQLKLRGDVFRPADKEVKLKEGDPVSPFFWAAFVLSGDWR